MPKNHDPIIIPHSELANLIELSTNLIGAVRSGYENKEASEAATEIRKALCCVEHSHGAGLHREVFELVQERLDECSLPFRCLTEIVDSEKHMELAYMVNTLVDSVELGNRDFMARLEGRLLYAD